MKDAEYRHGQCRIPWLLMEHYKKEFNCIIEIKQNKKISNMKLLLHILLIVLFLSSCSQNSNKEMSLNEKFIDINKMDINMKLDYIRGLAEKNELKYRKSYSEILTIQVKFDSIYNLIEKNNHNINHLLKSIANYTAKNYRYKTANGLDLLSKIDTKEFKKNEILAVVLELNSAILTDYTYNLVANDLSVNYISIVVIPKKKVLNINETYEAKIVIAAVDTTVSHFIKFNNETIKMTNGTGYLKMKAEKKGKNKLKGLVNLPKTNEDIIYAFPFNIEFDVK